MNVARENQQETGTPNFVRCTIVDFGNLASELKWPFKAFIFLSFPRVGE